MQTKEDYKKLRGLLIDKILETKSPDKPSNTALLKMKDEELVQSLFVNSILAERQFWVDDIKEAVNKINPNEKFTTTSTSVGLINRLINIVKNSNTK